MGKIRFSFLVIVVVFAAFACSIPSGVQVEGNLKVGFRAISTFDGLFTKQMKESFESDHRRFAIKPCSEPEILTYAMYLPIINEDQSGSLSEELENLFALSGMDVITMPDHNILLEGSAKEIKLAKLPDFLYGFEFAYIGAKVYSSGNDAADSFFIVINIINNVTGNHIPVEIDGRNRENKERSVSQDISGTECTWTELPDEDIEEFDLTEITNSNDAIFFDYKLYLKGGAEFKREWIEDALIRIELALWLPLILVPKNHEEGADITFTDVFGKGQDAFGRVDENDTMVTDAMEWANFVLKLNKNPFKNGVMHVVDNNVQNIPSKKIKGNSLKMAIPRKSMNEIKKSENFPFAPDMKIHFDYNNSDPEKNAMRIPRDFKTSTLSIEAGINYETELKDL